LENAARKIQKCFRGIKISKEKKKLLDEASVFFFFKDIINFFEFNLWKIDIKEKRKRFDFSFAEKQGKHREISDNTIDEDVWRI